MSVNEVGGSPEGRRGKESKVPDKGRFDDEMSRVQKTREIDPDKRKRNKERALGSNQEAYQGSRPPPSIYDPDFHGHSYGSAYPSSVPPSSPRFSDNQSLPHSPEFWQNHDPAPPEQGTTQPRQNQPRSMRSPEDMNTSPSQGTFHAKDQHKKRSPSKSSFSTEELPSNEEGSLFEGVSLPSQGALGQGKFALEQEGKKKGKEAASPLEEEAFSPFSPLFSPPKSISSKKKKKGVDLSDSMGTDGAQGTLPTSSEKRPISQPPISDAPIVSLSPEERKHVMQIASTFSAIRFEKEEHAPSHAATEPSLQVPPPSFAHLTPEGVHLAMHTLSYVTNPASIYNLFTQMVGTIIIMSSQGISKTEVLLNSPAFEKSPFFGSALVFEKYASAPDSFNIHLIGNTTQQVNAFAAALPDLYEAFQKGQFSFRVGRLDASYDPDRPLFRRKTPLDQAGADSGESEGEQP
ncbi:MAG: hypothetical protein AAGF04_02685 [Chlamydiota bacterium]